MSKLREMEGLYASIHIRYCFVDICADLNAGAVLSKLVYWLLPDRDNMVKGGIVRFGRLWAANTRESWWHHLRLEEKAFDRALMILVTKGFVVKKTMLYHNRRAIHVSLNEDVIATAIENFANSHNGNIQNPVSGVSNSSNKESYKEELTITKKHVIVKDNQPPAQWVLPIEEEPMSAEDVINRIKYRNSGKMIYKDTTTDMEKLWQRYLSLVYDGKFQLPLTIKDRVLFKRMLQSIGVRTPLVVEWVLQNWGLFLSEVALQKKRDGPIHPHIAFLYSHHDVAVNLWTATQSKVDKPEGVPYNDPPQVHTIAIPESTEDVVSQEEIDDAIKELQAIQTAKAAKSGAK